VPAGCTGTALGCTGRPVAHRRKWRTGVADEPDGGRDAAALASGGCGAACADTARAAGRPGARRQWVSV